MTWILMTIGLLMLFGSVTRALSAAAEVDRYVDQDLRLYPLAASVVIYKGALVGLNPAGYLKPFEPGDKFVGVAYESATCTSTAGAVSCFVFTCGDFKYALTSVALTDVGKGAYATADNAIALTGHPDAYVGRIVNYTTTDECVVRLKRVGEYAPTDGTCIDVNVDFSRFGIVNRADEVTTILRLDGTPLKFAAVGSGMSAGTSGLLTDEATGEIRFLIDNDNEAQNLTLVTPEVFNITKGITFEFEGRVKTAGNSTDDFSCGLMALSGGVTVTQHADTVVNTSGVSAALFCLDTDDLNIDCYSDDNATAVGPTDSTIDESLTVNKRFKIIVRAAGTVEFWVNEVRALSTTAFAVAAAGLMCGIVNLEKSGGTGVPEARLRKLRVAGAIA
jgi:hypothetical protein